MATKKSTADDWNKAIEQWTKTPTKKPTKKTTSTSDRLRDNDLGRTQGPATRPVSTSDRLRSGSSTPPVQTVKAKPKAKKKDTFSEALEKWKSSVVDPAISTSDRLRGNYNPPAPRTQYQVPEPQFDYGIDRVDTRPGTFTAQQQQTPTRTTTMQPYDPNAAQGPREQPTGINAWLPKNFAFGQPLGALAAAEIIRDPVKRDAAGQLIGAGLGAIRDNFTDSAAYERFDQTVDQNRADYEQRSNWGDVGQAVVNFGTNLWGDVAGMGRSLAEMSVGMKSGQEVATGAIENMNIAPYFAPAGELLDLNQYTGRIKQGAMNTLAGAQLGQDYLMTGFDVPEETPLVGDAIGGLPLGPINASLRYSGIDLLKNLPSMQSASVAEVQRLAMEWWESFKKYNQDYRDAVQPDTFQQQLQQGPTAQAMNRERSFLNWADPEAVAKTYDALTNQQTMVDEYNQKAAQAWQEGALSTSEAARDELWRQAAEAGSKAWQLENTHPQQLVNQNTNIVAQLIMELLTPDVTDLLGNVVSLAGLTPAARRLTRVADEVATPAEKVVRALDDMVVTGENAAQVAAQRSAYNKALNLWTTGRARANIATDNMLRYTVNLLGDVETPRDAAYLLTQLATDPRKLITGVPGAGFQSPGLLARMDEKGMVRFGAMNLQRIKEPLRIYQQAAQNILASPVLKDGPILNKVDFVTTFMDEMNQAGYKFFNVADEATEIPTGATTARIISTGKPSEYVLEYVDATKQVIGKSDPMTMAAARKLQKEVGSGTAAQKSLLGEIGAFQRAIVSPFYILSSPGTWATNIIGGLATAAGDGMVSLRSSKYIDDWIGKQFGVDPTARGFASVASAGSSASQVSGWGPFKFLKRAYGQIDEQVGKRVYYTAATKALRSVGKNTLTTTLTPLLQAAGVAEKDARRIITHLYETGLQGGDLTAEFNKLLNGQTKTLNLSDVNPIWLDAIPPDMVEGLNTIIRTATSRDEAVKAIQQWGQETAQYWDELIASGPNALPRYVWQKQEVLQDTADITQSGKMATKYGDVPADVAQATAKQLADEMTATQARMETLTQLVTESADPKNRYILYNIWGQVNDLTAGVRAQLNELAEAANGLTGPAKNKAWQEYWQEAERLWTDRNTRVNQLLEDSSAAISSGNVTPSRWDILERTAGADEAAAWEALKLDPGSGRYDELLQKTIDAGRVIGDRAVARAYAAARRFLNVDAMDYIVSAEHSVQMAGSQASNYLAKARDKAAASGKWKEYFALRNETWRQYRQYERSVWEQATRHITEDGVKLEAKGGAVVEDVAQADDLAGYYNKPKPKPVEPMPAATNKAIDDYLAQNAAANPYPPEATAIIDEATFEANLERLAAADVGFPGSRALDEAEGLRAERAAATVSGGAETRATLREQWDAQVKATLGLPGIDQTIARYTRNGVVDVPENAFEDLYGRTVAGTTINNQYDVNRLLQQYYDMSPQRKVAVPANRSAALTAGDLNALRKAANDAGIQTVTDAGRPMDKRLVNTINKDLGLKIRSLRDLTPEQYQAAMEALARRAGGGPEMRTLDFTVPAIDFEAIAKQLNLGGWWGKKDVAQEQADILQRTTEAGGATAGELSHGAAFAKQQLENILTYMENNMDEILQPGQRMIGQGSNLRALEEFRNSVLPAWDNVKYAASEYGNRMRSFTMVDFANQTRLDEILGLYMPYGFWMTRTAKNSLERAIFQPQIWRRVMQAEREIRSVQEQENAPERYEGAFPIMSADGVQQWLRLLPSKYWPAAGIFTSNDYADPESANSALGYAAESMRAANLSPYPWWDAAIKIKENLAGGDKWNNDIYWANYLPQGRIAAAAAIKYLGPEAAQYVVPGYFENSVARTLNNMAVKGEITREQARWAHDYLWQLKQGGEELPEEMTGAYDPKAIEAILDKAMRQAAGVDLNTALISWATGASLRPYDTAEGQWTGAAQNYRDYKYGPENPYGSKAAADTQKPDAALAWSKSGVWRPEEQRPGVSMATDAKSAEKEALNQELMAATDEFITGFNGTPENFEIDNFKKAWMADRVGGDPALWMDKNMDAYLDEKYPSATTFTPTGGERYPGYAPEEIQIKVRTAAYYKAKEEIEAPVSPVYPGDNATRAQYNEYFTAKDKYDLDKAAYDKAIVDRVAELINDPVAIRQLAGLPVTNAPTSISDYLRSNSADTFNLDNALGYPMRPTGEGTFDAGMTDLAGDPETAEAIIEAEKTKYMSELEKQVRAANGDSGGSGGSGGRSYNRRGYSNRRYSRGGYSRRSYGGGGGGSGGNYYAPDVYAKGLSEWLNVDPERVGYRAPNQVRVNVPDIGPEAIKAWRPLSWK